MYIYSIWYTIIYCSTVDYVYLHNPLYYNILYVISIQ